MLIRLAAKWPSKIDRGLVESLLTLDFVEHANNVVLVANSGLGKTMITQNLVHAAVLKGRSALFISATELLLDLSSQESPRALERKLRHYAKIGLLVIDEVGFIPFESRNADLFFQLVSRRYEKKNLVLTTNPRAHDEPCVRRMEHNLPQCSLRHSPHRAHRAPRGHRYDRGRELPSPRVSRRRTEAQRRPKSARQSHEGLITRSAASRASESCAFLDSDFRVL